ncbi:MAG: hypothetical protein FE78DRAFT_26351 [Acidomyces sp. 'richmondensis']|nr:MAG: hypothetical protein FE78DRAFT_26351 [Acidomyces sp. 'richmondensis']
MDNVLLSALCDYGSWDFHPYSSQSIKFDRDGIGELSCMAQLSYAFAVNMDWKILPQSEPEEPVEPSETAIEEDRKPQVLGRAKLEITLNATLAKSLQAREPSKFAAANERHLSEAAFTPRTFTIIVERGNFMPKPLVGIAEGDFRHRYGLRLLFDKSPFPSREGFKTPDKSPVSGFKFDEMDMFVASRLPQSETREKAMNDEPPRAQED